MVKTLEWINTADNALREIEGEKEEDIRNWHEILKEMKRTQRKRKFQILKIGE